MSGGLADLRAEVVFSDDDLARVRVSSRLELVSEVIGAAHHRHSQLQPSLRGWAQHTGEALGPIGAQVMRDLRSGAFLIRGLMAYADIDTDIGFDDRLETSLSRPTAEWANLRQLQSWGIPVQPGLAEGRPDALTALSGAARMFHDAAVAPYWDRMLAAAIAPGAGVEVHNEHRRARDPPQRSPSRRQLASTNIDDHPGLEPLSSRMPPSSISGHLPTRRRTTSGREPPRPDHHPDRSELDLHSLDG